MAQFKELNFLFRNIVLEANAKIDKVKSISRAFLCKTNLIKEILKNSNFEAYFQRAQNTSTLFTTPLNSS